MLDVPHLILSRNYLQFLYKFLINKENAEFIPDSIISKLSSSSVPFFSYNFMVDTYQHLLTNETKLSTKSKKFSCEIVRKHDHVYSYLIAPKVLSYNQTFSMKITNEDVLYIFIDKNYSK